MRPFVQPDFLSAAYCRRLREAMDRGVREAAEIAGDAIHTATEVRRAMSLDIDSALLAELEAHIDTARPALEAWFGRPLGAREGTGLLRYDPGGFYRPHRDRGIVAGWPGAARRAVAVVLFLNEDFAGGRLTLYPDGDNPVEVVPATGLLVGFRADLLHEVLPVTAGVRDAAVDWFYDEGDRPIT